MHINQIERLKDFGNYSSDVQLKYFLDTIEKFQVQDGLVLVPDFQRGHVWTKKQQIAFVEFILRRGKTSPFLFNHPGWIKAFEGEFVCVDGLQRLTALSLFLDNKLKVFNGHYRKDIEGIDTHLKRIYVSYYINDLKTRADVLEWYLELNYGGTVHSTKELSRVRELLTQEYDKCTNLF